MAYHSIQTKYQTSENRKYCSSRRRALFAVFNLKEEKMSEQFSVLAWLESLLDHCDTLGISQQTIESFAEHYLHVRLKGEIEFNDKPIKHFE